MLGSSTFQWNANGTTSAWVLFDNTGIFPGVTLITQFMNDSGGGVSPIASGATETIGEIWAGQRADFNIKRTIRQGYADAAKIRMSSGGAQWPVLVPLVRELTVDVIPISQNEAFNQSSSPTALIQGIANSSVVAVIPFEAQDPAAYPPTAFASPTLEDLKLVAQTAWLGQFMQAPVITQTGDLYYQATLAFRESI